jgi:hypothetical protein
LRMAGKRLAVIVVSALSLISACRGAVDTNTATPSPQVTAPVARPQASPTPAPVFRFDISGTNYYEDVVGSLRFLLEVKNSSGFAVEDVKATVLLRDAAGELVATGSGCARLDALGPGESAPVVVVFFLQAPRFSRYDVEIEARKADYLRAVLRSHLRVVNDTGRIGEWVPYEVLGQVYNAGRQPAQAVGLIVTCYDVQGRVVAVASGRPAQRTIPPGEYSDFLVSIGAVGGEIANCTTKAEAVAVAKSDD